MSTACADILLVEDNEDDIALIKHALRKEKNALKIMIARDGQEAIDYLFSVGQYAGKKSPLPRVMILDLNMPRLDGLEVLKIIRAENLTCLLPVVILTTSDQQRDIIESYEFGVNSYVKKPMDVDEFYNAIRSLQRYWTRYNSIADPV